MSRSSPSSASPSSRTRCRSTASTSPGRPLAPMLTLIGGALLLLVADSLSARKPLQVGLRPLHHDRRRRRHRASPCPLWDRVQDPDEGAFSTLGQAVGVDGFSVFATVTIAAAVILGALLMDGWLRREGMEGAEPYVLMLLSASGGVMMASANDLIVMFLGLEILSIAVYVLAAMHLRKITSQEAGVKYFVLGAFSSAFFLYGIAFTYGGTGSTNLVDIAELPRHHRAGRHRPRAGRAGPAPRRASPSRWPPCRSTSGRPTCTRARPARACRGWPPA